MLSGMSTDVANVHEAGGTIAERDRTIAERDRTIEQLHGQVEQLTRRVAELEAENARLKKNSSNSSKPPSSDIVKPKPKPEEGQEKKKGRRKRKRGGQKGHRKHERPLFPAEKVDHHEPVEITDPKVLEDLEPLDEFEPFQQVELVKKFYTVTEYRRRKYRCRKTGRIITAPLPNEVAGAGFVGPDLSAFIAYQKGACHMSYTTIQSFLDEVFDLSLSTGLLAKVVSKASGALEIPYLELEAELPFQAVLYVDETGHKDQGNRMWTWCFRAPDFTWFSIAGTRSSQVLEAILGQQFDGVLGCDYYSAYRKYMKGGDDSESWVTVQFCLAHLIRNVKFLTTLPDKGAQKYGKRLLKKLKKLFNVIHRRDQMSASQFQRGLERAQEDILRVAKRAPNQAEAQNLAERFRKHGAAYFTFITTPGVEPTNNLAEQAIRFVVIDRKMTQGTRGERGQRWCERIWTVLATCRQQRRSAFEFLKHAIQAQLCGQPPPSLLPVNA